MKLKPFLFAIAIFTLGACSNSADTSSNDGIDSMATEEEEAAVVVPDIEQDFSSLFEGFQKIDPQFSAANFEGGEAGSRLDSLYRPMDTTELRPFLPFLIYNPDSSLALDLVTRNYVPVTKGGRTELKPGAIDYQIGLIDMKKMLRKRLLFFGTTGAIFDAKWESDSAVVMIGTNEVTGSDSLRPVLWRYVAPTKSWQVFPYEKMLPGDWHQYVKQQ